LRLSSASFVDIDVVTRGSWSDAVRLPSWAQVARRSGRRDAAAYDTWLLSQQRHVAAASGGDPARGGTTLDVARALDVAAGYAARAVAMNPLDEEPSGAADPVVPTQRRG
jgi:hypothetical protein